MQCTAKYPAPLNTINLMVIPELIKKYDLPVGLSDHSREPIIAPIGAVALGAKIIEKHAKNNNTFLILSTSVPRPDVLTPTLDKTFKKRMVMKYQDPKVGIKLIGRSTASIKVGSGLYANRKDNELINIPEVNLNG